MPKGLGKGYKELTKKEKEAIVKSYNDGIYIKDLIKLYKTTKRAIPMVLKEYNINSKRKNRYTLNENYFETIDTEHKAYWLGFIAADGCITKTNYFAISLKDEDILLKFKNDLEYTGEVYNPQYNKGENIYSRINFSSKKLCDDLRKLGIYENKSLTYNKLPNIPDNLMHHFIRGYFDGDGSINRSGSWTYHSKIKNTYSDHYYIRYKVCIIATYDFCVNLNNYIKDKINYNGKIRKHNKSEMYYYNIYDKKALKNFYEYIYKDATIYLNRKYNIWKDFLGSYEEKSSLENKVNSYMRCIDND